MSYTKVCNFEGGTLTNTITTADSGSGDTPSVVSTTAGSTGVYDNAQFAHNAKALKITSGGASAKFRVGWGSLATTTVYPRGYYRLNGSFPAVNWVCQRGLASGGATDFDVRVNTSGKVEIRDSAGTILNTTAATVPTAAWFRIETDVDVVAKTITARLYSGANLDGATADTNGTISATAASLGSSIDQMLFGNCGDNNIGTIWLDDIVLGASSGHREFAAAESSSGGTTPAVDTNVITIQWYTCYNGAWVADTIVSTT